jgi:mercuric ion transport protein
MMNAIQERRAVPEPTELRVNQGNASRRLLAAGSLIGAVLASSCCIVPLVLVSLGISGAWIGSLTALAPYKLYFVAATVVLLGAGYWQVYIKPRRACTTGSYCASPSSGRITKVALWIATVVVALAMTISYWAPLFY